MSGARDEEALQRAIGHLLQETSHSGATKCWQKLRAIQTQVRLEALKALDVVDVDARTSLH